MKLHEIETSAVDNPSPYAQKHLAQYLESGGTETDHPMTDRLILLYVKGRKSGDVYRVPLVHFADGEDLLVVASKGGAPDHPSWYRNLVSDPQVWVRRRDEFFEARATELTPEERAPAWEQITTIAPGFGDYQTKTERTIPVVRLTRV